MLRQTAASTVQPRTVTDEHRFDRASWLVLAGALSYIVACVVYVLLAFQQPTDGWLYNNDLVLLFQILTGRLPFTGDNPGAVVLAHLHQPSPDPRALLPDLPAHIAQAILRALAKDPAERHQTAGALAAELDAE